MDGQINLFENVNEFNELNDSIVERGRFQVIDGSGKIENDLLKQQGFHMLVKNIVLLMKYLEDTMKFVRLHFLMD